MKAHAAVGAQLLTAAGHKDVMHVDDRHGIAALAALEIIEWPIRLTLAAGHLLAATRGNKALQAFGDALEQA
jgi:hypothetical protein